MENDRLFQYIKLILENVSIWQILGMCVVGWLLVNRDVLSKLPEYISRLEVGSVKVELRELKNKLNEAEGKIEVLGSELQQERQRFDDILKSFNPHAPVSELSEARQALKSIAPTIENMIPVLDGLKPAAPPDQVYAAAEILRARHDPAYFDQLVEALDRFARDPNLCDIRLHTIWTLAAALHRTLVADIKNNNSPSLSEPQLLRARDMLQVLNNNPRVLEDCPEAPMGGVRGPAKWAGDWIEKGLKRTS